ncbi:MAG: ATP-binding protein [Sodaliphilus sp.]
MSELLIGRDLEIKALEQKYASRQSEFVAVFGRRRVGKTFLVRECFARRFAFQVSGIANTNTRGQLTNFHATLCRQAKVKLPKPKNWIEAFELLINHLEQCPDGKKVVFLDELPWMDTPYSKFIQALEHFWNGWASMRSDILLIVCGSATSWMTNNLINSHGGLHNRVTYRIHIEPFTLNECERYFATYRFGYNRYQIAQCYMAMGGIPFYLNMMQKGLSVDQNIDLLFFKRNALLQNEFHNLFASLFSNSDKYIDVVASLAKKNMGLTRDEIILATKGINSGGELTTILRNLEQCGFVRKYRAFGKTMRNTIYQLIDPFTLFYYRFLQGYSNADEVSWIEMQGKPSYYNWLGHAFETLCLNHANQIKQELGIIGMETHISAWKSRKVTPGAQIDLVIDRADQTINLCEMKFSKSKFSIDAAYEKILNQIINAVQLETNTRKALQLVMVTTYGVEQNIHSGIVNKEVTLDSLFKEWR